MAEQTLKDVANQALVSLIQNATDALTFLKGEVPLAVKELLTYYSALYIAQAIALVIVVGVAAIWARKWQKAHNERIAKPDWKRYGHADYYDGGWCLAAGYIPAGAVLIVSVASAPNVVANLLKITLAPRIWLLEYASHLVK